MAIKDEDEPEENGAESGEGGSNKSKKKLIIIIAAAIVLLGGVGAGLYFSGILGKKGDATEESAEDATHEEAKEGEHGKPGTKGAAKAGMPTFYELPEFLVNLNTDGKGLSFIKMTVVLEIANAKDVESLDAMQPRVVNDFNTYLRELRSSDLAGSTGLERLREELLMRVNKSVSPVQVSDILFKEIVVQ